MGISYEYAIEHAEDCAVLSEDVAADTLITETSLEDPQVFPDLIESGLLNLDGCLKIKQVLRYSRLLEAQELLTPITPDLIDRYIEDVPPGPTPRARRAMTIQELITKIRTEKPNSFTDEKLIGYINEIEEDVAEQLDEDFDPYTAVDDTELIAPAPYDRLYVSYLKAMIDYANEEYPSYQLNADQHNQDFTDFINFIVRERFVTNRYTTDRFKNIF